MATGLSELQKCSNWGVWGPTKGLVIKSGVWIPGNDDVRDLAEGLGMGPIDAGVSVVEDGPKDMAIVPSFIGLGLGLLIDSEAETDNERRGGGGLESIMLTSSKDVAISSFLGITSDCTISDEALDVAVYADVDNDDVDGGDEDEDNICQFIALCADSLMFSTLKDAKCGMTRCPYSWANDSILTLNGILFSVFTISGKDTNL